MAPASIVSNIGSVHIVSTERTLGGSPPGVAPTVMDHAISLPIIKGKSPHGAPTGSTIPSTCYPGLTNEGTSHVTSSGNSTILRPNVRGY